MNDTTDAADQQYMFPRCLATIYGAPLIACTALGNLGSSLFLQHPDQGSSPISLPSVVIKMSGSQPSAASSIAFNDPNPSRP